MAIVDLSPLSESSWISGTSINHGDSNVDRIGDVYIDINHTISTASLAGCARIVGPDGVDVADIFDPIDVRNDYNSIRRRLTLHLSTPLEKLTQYSLIIDGLYSPTGEGQDQPHIISFITCNAEVDLTPEIAEEDLITVVDKTIISKPLVIVEGTQTVNTLVRTLPTNGAYNLAPAYNDGVVLLVFSEDVPADPSSYVTVERRVISAVDTALETVTATITRSATNDHQIEIQLPEITTGVYLEIGHEYIITVSGTLPVGTGTLTTDRTIRFCGQISPMFASVQNVLMNYPGTSSYDVALMIFYASSEVMGVQPSMDADTPTKPAIEYTLYSTLARLADINNDDFRSVQLADLKIDLGDGFSLAAKWRALADQAWARLAGSTGPRVGIKGGSTPSPFVTRDWNSE